MRSSNYYNYDWSRLLISLFFNLVTLQVWNNLAVPSLIVLPLVSFVLSATVVRVCLKSYPNFENVAYSVMLCDILWYSVILCDTQWPTIFPPIWFSFVIRFTLSAFILNKIMTELQILFVIYTSFLREIAFRINEFHSAAELWQDMTVIYLRIWCILHLL